MRALVTVVAAAAVAAPAVAAASAASAPGPNAAVEIGTAKIAKLGTVLVTGHGHVLYMFQPDNRSRVACNSACQKIWPADVAPRSGVAKAIDGARQSLIGSDRNPADGRRIVTYDGWPLYTYVLDTQRHQYNGQDVALNGGLWWVLTPSGQAIRTAVSHGGGYVGS